MKKRLPRQVIFLLLARQFRALFGIETDRDGDEVLPRFGVDPFQGVDHSGEDGGADSRVVEVNKRHDDGPVDEIPEDDLVSELVGESEIEGNLVPDLLRDTEIVPFLRRDGQGRS